MANQFQLMSDRRFAPLFATMSLGAFNDNLFKTTLVVLVAYGVWDLGGLKPEMLVSLSAALFILPYILMAPVGGSLADKYDKAKLMRWLKIAEIFIVLAVILGLYLESLMFLYVVLFAFGAHSALFSPPKYAIVPQHMKRDELIGANALLNTGSFIAILAGNILGSLWGISHEGHMMAFIVLLACAVFGYVASRFIPPAPPPAPDLKLKWNLIADIRDNFRFTRTQPRGVMVSLLGIAWFYFLGGTFIAQFPNFAKQSLGVDHIVLSIFMGMFTVGIVIGGLLNNLLLKSRVSARFVTLSIFGIGLFCCDLYFAALSYDNHTGSFDLKSFLSHIGGWRIFVDILGLSIFSGLYVVPLNAILQDLALPAQRARILSVSNVMDAGFILFASFLGMAVFAAGLKVEHLFLLEGIMTLGVGVYFWRRPRIFGEAYA